MILFFRPYTCDIPVVFHSYEQLASVGIGKSRQGSCNLFCIVDLKLEIQLLVLALLN
jgi:hypothetical protein